MHTVSFLVEFVEPTNQQQNHHLHEITVYESTHAPGFLNRCRADIIKFVNLNYGHMAFGYTHHVKTFSSPLGKHMLMKDSVMA